MSNFFMEVNLIDLSDEDGRRALHAEEGEPETDEERLEKLKGFWKAYITFFWM